MKVAKDLVVEIDYTLKDDTGSVLDSSDGGMPLPYLHGHGGIIPGLEKALEGKVVGDSLNVKVQPKDGYGELNPMLVNKVPKKEFQGIPNLEVGMQLQAQTPQGMQIYTVKEITATEVTVDGNHPLAGMILNFDVEIKNIRTATEEELAHGHVHGPGGAHHH